MPESIITVSRSFFHQVVKPVLDRHFPAETAQTAFGLFGYGSEAMGLDDEFSRDHHFGLRIDALMPEAVFQSAAPRMMRAVADELPSTFMGHSLREGHLAGTGLSCDSLEAFLYRTIGLRQAPVSWTDWLSIPEEDINHIVNGEVWHDEAGTFSALRHVFDSYYPEPVRIRRIAHWCRYFSGMGTYALKRALLRQNIYYANIAFSRCVRWGVQLAFMLERVYFPYDKWIMHAFRALPVMYPRMGDLVAEAVALSTPWPRKLELMHRIADIIDAELVRQELIAPHDRFGVSPTSGYRLLEHAYAELIQRCPESIRTLVPEWDQVFLEEFHSGYVASLSLAEWDGILDLKPRTETS